MTGFDSLALEQENDRGIDNMADRIQALKRVTLDINEEVDAHNKMLDRMVRLVHHCLTVIGTHLSSRKTRL